MPALKAVASQTSGGLPGTFTNLTVTGYVATPLAIGSGITASGWGPTLTAMDIGSTGALAVSTAGTTFMVANYYTPAGQVLYKANGYAGSYQIRADTGQHRWYLAPLNSSGAGATCTVTQAMTLTAGNNLLLGGTTDPGGSNAVYMANRGSVPGTPTNGGALYVEGGALKYIGSSGTITTLAPA